MVGDQGEYGGIGFCLHTGETAPDAAFAMAGFGNDLDRQADPIIGYAGLVDSRVATVELRLAGGDTTTLPLYDAPAGVGARYFEVFVHAGDGGRIVALAADGSQLGSGGLCLDDAARPDQHRVRSRARGRELRRLDAVATPHGVTASRAAVGSSRDRLGRRQHADATVEPSRPARKSRSAANFAGCTV